MKEKYYTKKAISNSALSKLNPEQSGNPMLFWDFFNNKLKVDRSNHLLMGIEIHKLILEPEKSQTIATSNIPPPSIKTIIEDVTKDIIFSEISYSTNMENWKQLIMKKADKLEFQKNWNYDTRYNKIKKAGEKYFRDLLYYRSRGIELISEENKTIIDACVSSLKSNETAKYLIDKEELLKANKGKNIEVYNELEIYWDEEVNGNRIPCKAKIDRVIIDYDKKEYFLIDLKSTGKSLEKYPNEYELKRHYRQNAFYNKGLSEFLYKEHNIVFKLVGSYNIVVEKQGYFRTRVFKSSDEYLSIGVLEYRKLLERYLFHLENGFYESMEETINNGIIILNPKDG